MSQELLYTSAPNGLKPGSRGFCTVLSTQGMAAPLASALEGLSGYRPVYPPTDEQNSLNPVNWSHVTLAVAGRTWHILSRVAEYGLDYSQRTNKLAHHVVLDSGEQITAGPAALLSSSGFMRDEWNEEPHLAPTKPVPKIPPRPRGVCQAWKDLTGDGGWAGVIAESFLRDPERPVILLYAPGQDMLPLINEALSLIPANRRWEVTFTTYFTGLPQTVNCNWRCMLHDSPEAHQSLRFVRALRFDLTNPDNLGIASGNELVADARGVPRLKSGAQGSLPPLPMSREVGTADEHLASDADEYGLAEDLPPLPGSNLPGSRRQNIRSAPRVIRASETATDILLQRRKVAFKIAGLAVVLLLLVGLGLAFIISYRRGPAPLVADTTTPQPHPADTSTPIKGEPTFKFDAAKSKAGEKPTKNEKELSQTDVSKKSKISPGGTRPETAAAKVVSDPRPPKGVEQPVHPQPEKEIKLPTGSKSVPLNKSPEGVVTKLIEIEGDTIPQCRIALFSPAITHLTLEKSTKDKSRYSIIEEGNKFELGSIAWKGIKDETELLGQRSSLNLTAGNGLSKFKRLEWCEIDVESGSDSHLTVSLHQFPMNRNGKDRETPIAANSNKRPVWGIQWNLKIETDELQFPPILSDRIILSIDSQEFTFRPTGGSKIVNKSQLVRLTDEKFREFVLKSLSNNEVKRSAGQVFLQLSTKVETLTNESPGPVVTTLSLEGWSHVSNAHDNQRKSAAKEIDNFLKDAAKYGPKGGRPPRNIESKDARLTDQANTAISEVGRLLDLLSISNDPEASKAIAKAQLEKKEKYFKDIITAETEIEKLQDVLKEIEIKSVSLYYDIASSDSGTKRQVQIFDSKSAK